MDDARRRRLEGAIGDHTDIEETGGIQVDEDRCDIRGILG